MRTADLARKNRELAEALDKLTRAQEQLVRSEKLASIGQLVAGIAHEINNPVKAIVTALHNYSRTDDESVVDFDVDRSIDDSLELLRHLLKDKTVTKHYGDV